MATEALGITVRTHQNITGGHQERCLTGDAMVFLKETGKLPS